MPPEALAAPIRTSPEWEPKRFDIIRFLARVLLRFRMIAAVTALFAVLAVVYSLLQKPYFEGRATFMPPQRELSLASGLTGGGLLGSGLFGTQQSAMYIGFLNSRSVQENVIQRAHLLERFQLKDPDDARKLLAAESKFDMETNGVITVTVHDPDPQRASDIANAYLEGLFDLNRRIAQTAVTQRGTFYNDQVGAARASLEAAETKLLANQEQGGILDPQGSIQISLSTEARLQASIQSAEVELHALMQSQTEQSPEVVRLRSRIDELRSQLAQQSSRSSHGQGIQAGGAIPRLSLEAARRRRDVLERETIYEAILRQADYTKLSAEDPGPSLQVIDDSRVQKHKAGPGRVRIVEQATVFGFVLSFLWAAAEPFARSLYTQLRTAMKAGGVSA